jgi:hypothetical protein
MCEKPKREIDNSEPDENEARPRSYYYDDAHGYEDFDPESDEIEADEDESA